MWWPNFDYFDFDNMTWTDHEDLSDNPMGAAWHQTIIDEDTGDVWIIGTEKIRDIYQYDLSAGMWIKRYDEIPGIATQGLSPSRYAAAFDQQNEKILLIGNGLYVNIDVSQYVYMIPRFFQFVKGAHSGKSRLFVVIYPKPRNLFARLA